MVVLSLTKKTRDLKEKAFLKKWESRNFFEFKDKPPGTRVRNQHFMDRNTIFHHPIPHLKTLDGIIRGRGVGSGDSGGMGGNSGFQPGGGGGELRLTQQGAEKKCLGGG